MAASGESFSRSSQAAEAIASSGNLLRISSTTVNGRGLYTSRDIDPGAVLLTESPVVWMQTPGNESASLACAWCMVRLGSLSTQLAHIGVDSLPPANTNTIPHSAGGPAPVKCEDCGVAFYCSIAHRHAHRAHRHGAFCSSSSRHRAASQRFRTFAAQKVRFMRCSVTATNISTGLTNLFHCCAAESHTAHRCRNGRRSSNVAAASAKGPTAAPPRTGYGIDRLGG
jgi:hypothetical protein